MGQQESKDGDTALRIGVFLKGRLLEEHLFEKPQTVRIGRSSWRNDIVVCGASAPDRLKIFSKRAGGFCLNLSSHMKARLALCQDGQARLLDLSKLARPKKHGGVDLPLDRRMRGKLTVGELTLLFHFTTSTRRARLGPLPSGLRGGWVRGASPLTAAALVLSAVLQLGFLGWVLSQDWPEQLDDQMLVDNSFAGVLSIPSPDDAPEADEDDKNQPELEADGGEPSEASAPTEQAETPPPKDSEPSDRPEPESASADRLRMAEQVEKETMLSILSARSDDGEGTLDGLLAAAAEQDIDSAFAGSKKVRTGRLGDGKLAGSGGRDSSKGNTVGVGGLERTTGAREAGGDVDTGDKAEQAVACESCRMKPLAEEPADPDAYADPKAISAAIKRIEGRIQSCYERRAKQYPQLAGKVIITFEITQRGSRGQVTSAHASVDSVGEGVGECVAKEIRRLRLPAPQKKSVMVNKAFIFERGG